LIYFNQINNKDVIKYNSMLLSKYNQSAFNRLKYIIFKLNIVKFINQKYLTILILILNFINNLCNLEENIKIIIKLITTS